MFQWKYLVCLINILKNLVKYINTRKIFSCYILLPIKVKWSLNNKNSKKTLQMDHGFSIHTFYFYYFYYGLVLHATFVHLSTRSSLHQFVQSSIRIRTGHWTVSPIKSGFSRLMMIDSNIRNGFVIAILESTDPFRDPDFKYKAGFKCFKISRIFLRVFL